MNYEELSTDSLIKIVITETGLPLPKYDYGYRQYTTKVPVNIPMGNKIAGINAADLHDTFRDGCLRLIYWYNNIK